MKYQFITDCVSSCAKDIHDMTDNAREITYETFRRYVDTRELEEMLGYKGSGLKIKNDWAVSFYRSKYRGKTCVYILWSSIEYIYSPQMELL